LAREIVTQSFFNHVNLVKLYGTFADQTNVYLIMEYCSGGQLYDIFKVKSKLKDEEWVPIMTGVCEGIFALHLHDVIHRDLKPENIILAFGLPKVGDFGWAVHTAGDRRDTFCGTPLYISPELLMGGSYDKEVDIWALGVMMFEFVTGRIPFRLSQNKKLA
jgi:serine/threonine protein kinase